MEFLAAFAPYALLVLFLLVGLFLYERTGQRLGGVIVLPLLLAYTLQDLNVILVFALAAITALTFGMWATHHTLLYGRRLFVLFLVAGAVGTAAARVLVPTSIGTVTLALLPGIFAFNLHREGNYLKSTSAFMLGFGLLLGVGSLLLGTARGTLPQVPPLLSSLSGPASGVQTWAAHLEPLLARAGASLQQALGALFASAPGIPEGSLAASTVLAVVPKVLGPEVAE